MRSRGVFPSRQWTRRKFSVAAYLPISIFSIREDRGCYQRKMFEGDSQVRSRRIRGNKECCSRIGPSITLVGMCILFFLLTSKSETSAHGSHRNISEVIALQHPDEGAMMSRRRSLSSDPEPEQWSEGSAEAEGEEQNDDGDDENDDEEEEDDEHPFNIDLLNDDRVFHEDPEDLQHELPAEYAANFSWEDVDLSRKGSCGVDKCFWPSKSSQVYGYLFSAESNYDEIRRCFHLARHLQETCSISHLYAGPAVLLNVTAEQMQQLDQQTFNPSRFKVGQKSPYVFYVGDRTVVMQKVIVAPQPHLLYGTAGTKWDAMMNDIPNFKNYIHPRLFRRQLKQERSKIECALRHERSYWKDFQGLIDTNGVFYHMDLDAHFDVDPLSDVEEAESIQSTLADFDEMMQEFSEKLTAAVN